jgi:hypothetical protein
LTTIETVIRTVPTSTATKGNAAMFTVTKTFLEGALKGLTIEDRSPVAFTIGKVYGGGWTGSRYRVDACQKEA